ncbi:hypothetical protein OIU77_021078 [Salix suchowensis]|uniref:Secreted protein n=1 Tax=Salix suchowensis TaxID=1278906 RepID=A0ABQ9CCE2_9ROSI|nr:hypothetical protein OIU77_021078 [Salix suchowensis]
MLPSLLFFSFPPSNHLISCFVSSITSNPTCVLCKRIIWDSKTCYYQTLERLNPELKYDFCPFESCLRSFCCCCCESGYLIVMLCYFAR